MESNAGRTHGDLPTTHWSMIARAAGDDAAARREALEDLLKDYLPVLRGFVIARYRVQPERADDIVQSFVADKLLERNLFGQADRTRGRFRSLLLTALQHYALNCFRASRVAGREGSGAESLNTVEGPIEIPGGDPTPGDQFEVHWVRQIIDHAAARMRDECVATRRGDLWANFEGRVLSPFLTGAEPADYSSLVTEFKLASPAQASNRLMTAQRMFRRCIEEEIGRYELGASVEEEIDALFEALAHGSSGPLTHDSIE